MALDLNKIGNTLSTQSPSQIISGQMSGLSTPKTLAAKVNSTPVQSLPLVNPNVNYFTQPENFKPALSTQTPVQSMTPTLPKLSSNSPSPSPSLSADPNAQIAEKYKSALPQAQASGQPAPQTSGQGSAAITQYTGGQTPTPQINPVDTMMAEDKGLQDLTKLYNDFTSSQKQQESLVDEYKRLQKESGVEDLNTELINSKKIIEGTEQDIRNEISAVGGFGTESQVQALAGARNKGLIKNYNALLETRDNALNSINTMMGLSQQDRQYAQQQFENQFNFQKQMIEYRDKFVNNAKEGYNAIIKAQGYEGLLNALQGDPSSIALVERTLGLAPGGLQQLASYQAPVSEADQLDLEGKRLSNEKARRDLQGGGDKVLSVSEAKDLGVPYGTTQSQAFGMGITPGIGERTEKAVAKAQSTPEYKTINGVLPAVQSLKAYKDAIDKYGTYERLSGEGKGTLEGTYGNAIASWKTLAGLGALSGADFALAENAVPSTGLFKRDSTAKAKINASLKTATDQAEALTKRLVTSNPDASQVINSQLIDVLKTAYPERNYVLSPDGREVIQLTN